MSIIAYRDGVLAADTSLWTGSIMTSCGFSKIVRAPSGALLGGCGEAKDVRAFHDWGCGGFDPNKRPTVHDGFEGLVIWDRGKLTEYNNDLVGPLDKNDEFTALGEPWEFALGAMSAGASAVEAVELCIRNCAYAGGVIECLAIYEGGVPPSVVFANKLMEQRHAAAI